MSGLKKSGGNGDTQPGKEDDGYMLVESVMKQRSQANRRRRKQQRDQKRSTGISGRCVSIVEVKPRELSYLPLSKGDVIDILLREPNRWKGKCNGRSGWFDKSHVLLVMNEEEQKKFLALTDQEDTSRRGSGVAATDVGDAAEFEVKVGRQAGPASGMQNLPPHAPFFDKTHLRHCTVFTGLCSLHDLTRSLTRLH